jgi:hypothetical protein
MRRQALVFRLLGSGWLILGLVCLALSGSQIGGTDWAGRVTGALSGDAATLWHVFHHPLIAIVLLVWGAMCIVLGWDLIRLMNWAQPLARAMHLLLAVYFLVALTAGAAIAPKASGFIVVNSLLLTANLGLGYVLRGRLAGEVFSYIPLRTTPIVPRRCEFCGSSLNMQTDRCPECEPAIKTGPRPAAGEREKPALVAQFVSLDDDTIYLLSSQRPTFVGRALSRNDINLNNPTVSRQHARVEYDVQNSRYVLIAMQDVNGTFVNDRLIRQRPLCDGDKLRFGRAKFRFQVVSGMESPGG